eukprot:5486546-Pleurochrysis_carterae.AAC.1
MEAKNPKAIGEFAAFRELKGRRHVYMAAKLYKPKGEPKARSILCLVPPGRIIHRTGEDKSESVEMCFNLATINQVRAASYYGDVPRPCVVSCKPVYTLSCMDASSSSALSLPL